MDKVVERVGKVVNVLRCVAGSEWGAGRGTMMMVYRAMVRSVLDYGCLAYGGGGAYDPGKAGCGADEGAESVLRGASHDVHSSLAGRGG